MAPSGAAALRQRQTENVIRMLNLNERGSGAAGKPGAPDVYKVLILDSFTRDIISPLIRLNELRRQGITLYLMLESNRQNVPDVPAIYFCRPTPDAVKRITEDLAMGTYEVAHLNFAAPLSAMLMQELATGLVSSNAMGRLAKLHDQYLAFVSLEADLFSLMQPRTYVTLNAPSSKDADIERCVAAVVEGLFCVAATGGAVPVIRCQKGGIAEHVARGLDDYLRQHASQRGGAFSDHRGTHRPLLVLFDRNFDLTTQLQHPWSYHGLVHDTLGLKLGRVTVPGAPSAGQAEAPPKTYDVGPDDFFWRENGGKQFPKVAEEVEHQLNKYKRDMAAINAQTAGPSASMGGAAAAAAEGEDDLRANTKSLMNAVSSLPELTERKRVIDKHTNVATALLAEIKARQLDTFCATEDELLSGKADKAAMLKVLGSPRGTPSDKLRLALTWLLSSEQLPGAQECAEVEQMLAGCGADVRALAYVRKLRSLRLTGSQRSFSAPSMPSSAPGANNSQGNILDLADKLYSQGLSAVTKGVKTLMGAGRTFAVTRATQSLMEGRGEGDLAETWAYLDPKLPKGASPGERARVGHRDAIVCVVGAGNHLEYHSLKEMAARMQPKCNIVYGATEVLAPDDFLLQLQELGQA